MRQGSRITKQVAAAPGVVGWSLGANLPTLEFYTLSAWETPEDLRTFLTAGAHSEAASKLSNDMRRDSIFVQFKVLGKDLPLRWDDAIQRQDARLS